MNRTKNHFPFLDIIRGVAILTVFAFHCLGAAFGTDHLPWGDPHTWAKWFRDFSVSEPPLVLTPLIFGWAGVAIFFVVSGFCIHLSFLRSSARDWREFFVRRFFRIYPPYLLALLFFALIFPPTRLWFQSPFDWKQLVSHLFLVHNYSSLTYFGINGSFWSIAVETQLYLIYPLLIALSGRIGWKWSLVLLCALEVLLRASPRLCVHLLGVPSPPWIAATPFIYWYSWATGAAVADAFFHQKKLPFSNTPTWSWFLLALGTFLVMPLAPFSFLFVAVCTATIIGKSLQKADEIPAQNSRILAHLRLLGTWSYSFYLWHQPFVKWVPRELENLKLLTNSPFLVFFLCLATYPFILTLSAVTYKICELPSAQLGKVVSRRLLKRAAI